MAVAEAILVFAKAITASPFAPRAEPALKPNHPNQKSPVPLPHPQTMGDHAIPVSYKHPRAHETPEHLVCRLLLEKKKKKKTKNTNKKKQQTKKNKQTKKKH